jgi:hypothetical protein
MLAANIDANIFFLVFSKRTREAGDRESALLIFGID